MTTSDGVTAPGNLASGVYGCVPDLLLSYMAAAVTGSHTARAILVDEEAVF